MTALATRSVPAVTPQTVPSLLRTWMWAGLAVTAAAIAYYPIVGHYFYGDDFSNLYRMRNEPLLEYILKPQGGHLFVTSYSIFYLSDLLFGLNPQPYFARVLALHLVNTILLFAVLRRVTGSDLAACVGATLWGVCPTHEGTLGWYSVFGQAIVGTVVLWLLYDLAGVEQNGMPGWGMRVRWVILLLVSATSFGTGLAVGLVFPLLVWLTLPRVRERRAIVGLFAGVALFIPVLYVSLHRLYQGPPIGLEIPHEIGIHHLVERFGSLLVTMTLRGAAYGIATTLVSTLHPTVRFPSPLADAVVAVFLIACILSFSTGTHRTRRYLLVALVVMLASYAMVVAGRVGFDAAQPGLIYTNRYHYVASIGVPLAVALILCEAGRRVRVRSRWMQALLCLWVIAVVAARLRNGDPPDPTQVARQQTFGVLRSIQAAIETTPSGEDVYIPNGDFAAMGPFSKAHIVFPGWAGVFVIYYPDNVVDGRNVYFIEPEYRVVRLANLGRRTAGLLKLQLPPPPAERDGNP